MERTKFTKEEFENIKQLVDCALCSSNKVEAKTYISKLNFCGYDIIGNTSNIFSALVSCVENASGRVSDKESKIYFVHQELNKLKRYGVERES